MGILNNSIIGTILAIMLIYALLSILVSLLLEGWNQFRKTRAKNLKNAIQTMIDGQEGSSLIEKFYNHYMIAGASKENKNSNDSKDDGIGKKPINYISERLFTQVFMDIINNLRDDKQKKNSAGKSEMEMIKEGIENIVDNDRLKELLESFYRKADGKIEKFEESIKEWFNEFMGRVSGWYKKAQRYKLFIAGIIIAVGLNVDSIFLFNVISKNDTLRNELTKVAENVADGYSQLDSIQKDDPNELLNVTKSGIQKIITSTKATEQVVDTAQLNNYILKLEAIAGQLDSVEQKKYEQTKEALALVSDLSIPIGWKEDRAPLSWFNPKEANDDQEKKSVLKAYIDKRNTLGFWNVVLYILGIVISAFSLSFGAPFWFEMLAKLVNLRRLGKSSSSK
jgi:hypothetical protein